MDAEANFEIERRLVALVRSTGPLRTALAEIARWLVHKRAWERLGYARLGDYVDERTGRSARSVQDLARVGESFDSLPRLRAALVNGRLGWTKVRLIARVARPDDEVRWIEHARAVTAQELSREVRKIDVGSVERDALERDRSPSKWFEVACTPEVRGQWLWATTVAQRVSGGPLTPSDAAEVIAAEVLSAIPMHSPVIEAPEEPEETDQAGTSWPEAVSPSRTPLPDPSAPDEEEDTTPPRIRVEIEALVRDVESAGPFELDRRLRSAVAMEQRLNAKIGPLLDVVMRRRIYWTLGYASREGYVRERLGLEPSWGRALLRIERAARASPTFARAYREGEVTALQAGALVALVGTELSERWIAAWIARARQFTLRRLREDVDRALLVCETDFARWMRTGGLPTETGDAEREIGADESGPGGEEAASDAGREIGAQQSAPRETCAVRAIIHADVVRLLRSVLCSVRRHIDRVTGHVPTEGEALGVMLEHALGVWGALDEKVRKAHQVFARDGWRCAVPGCSSMRNLHDHHIIFRSAGGSDDPSNRLTLCAFHHLRGVHAGIIDCKGTAPNALRITLGVRSDGPPLATYASGDRLLAA
jgi:hypothetical protein